MNSTSATLALARDRPVCTIGEAIYDMPGLTHQGHLDTFGRIRRLLNAGLYKDFRRVLVDRCLVRGGLASKSAVSSLVDGLSGAALRLVPDFQTRSRAREFDGGEVTRARSGGDISPVARAGRSAQRTRHP